MFVEKIFYFVIQGLVGIIGFSFNIIIMIIHSRIDNKTTADWFMIILSVLNLWVCTVLLLTLGFHAAESGHYSDEALAKSLMFGGTFGLVILFSCIAYDRFIRTFHLNISCVRPHDAKAVFIFICVTVLILSFLHVIVVGENDDRYFVTSLVEFTAFAILILGCIIVYTPILIRLSEARRSLKQFITTNESMSINEAHKISNMSSCWLMAVLCPVNKRRIGPEKTEVEKIDISLPKTSGNRDNDNHIETELTVHNNVLTTENGDSDIRVVIKDQETIGEQTNERNSTTSNVGNRSNINVQENGKLSVKLDFKTTVHPDEADDIDAKRTPVIDLTKTSNRRSQIQNENQHDEEYITVLFSLKKSEKASILFFALTVSFIISRTVYWVLFFCAVSLPNGKALKKNIIIHFFMDMKILGACIEPIVYVSMNKLFRERVKHFCSRHKN